MQLASRLLAQEHGVDPPEPLGVLVPNRVFRARIRACHGAPKSVLAAGAGRVFDHFPAGVRTLLLAETVICAVAGAFTQPRIRHISFLPESGDLRE
jgi:hypothetical protein